MLCVRDGGRDRLSTNVRFASIPTVNSGLWDSSRWARAQNRCAIARCAGSPTASAVIGGEIVNSGRGGVTFRYKDYRADGRARYKVMTLGTHEFIRRFLIHVLPHGFHRIRHYGLFANSNRAANIARARELLAVPSRLKEPETSKAAIDEPRVLLRPCPCCGGRMIIIETFARGCEPKHQPETTAPVIRIDTS